MPLPKARVNDLLINIVWQWEQRDRASQTGYRIFSEEVQGDTQNQRSTP